MGGEGTAAPPLHKSESREGSLSSPTPLPPPAGSAEASAGDGAEEAGKNLDGSLGADSVATDEDVEVDVEVDEVAEETQLQDAREDMVQHDTRQAIQEEQEEGQDTQGEHEQHDARHSTQEEHDQQHARQDIQHHHPHASTRQAAEALGACFARALACARLRDRYTSEIQQAHVASAVGAQQTEEAAEAEGVARGAQASDSRQSGDYSVDFAEESIVEEVCVCARAAMEAVLTLCLSLCDIVGALMWHIPTLIYPHSQYSHTQHPHTDMPHTQHPHTHMPHTQHPHTDMAHTRTVIRRFSGRQVSRQVGG